MGDSKEQEKEKRRKKQFKRMGKILATAWDWDEQFQDSLQALGESIDSQAYKLGRHGWEAFAQDLGGVFHKHIHG